ncbi:MAG: TraC family protein [Halobacteriovoraceae bacterium]|nr:TraC family protein [Halobacteriovoraceae bacterium]
MEAQEILKPINKALTNRYDLADALFKRSESLSSLLPYSEYIEDFKMFINKDGSLGVVLEAELLEHEPMTANNIIGSVNAFKSLFSLPENCVLQVLYDQSYISKEDKCWENILTEYKYPHPVSKLLFEEKVKMIRDKCNSDDEMAPLIRKSLITIKYFPTKSALAEWKQILAKGEKVLFTEMSDFVRQTKEFCQIVNQYIENSKISLKHLDAQQLITDLRRFFNPKEFYKRDFAKFNKNISISDQLIYNSPVLDYVGIEREKIKTRTITLKTSPQLAYAGGMAYFTKLKFPYKISLNFSFPSKTNVKKFFDVKEFFLENSVSGKAKIQREEIKSAQNRLAMGEKCLFLTFCIVIEGETDEILDKRTRELVNVFHNDLECEVIIEDEIGLGLVLNSLPLNYSPEADHSTQRYIRILQNDAIMFLPFFDSFKGLENPLQIYTSREKNLVKFNLLENETSNHTVVLADSGSGKSAFIIDCIQSAKKLDPEPLVFVIDKKSSYKGVVGPFNGELTVFDPNGEMPFTPFRGEFDDAKVNFLTNLLTTGIKLTSPTFEIESEHLTSISKALKLAYLKRLKEASLEYIDGELISENTNDDIEVTMDDFVASMASLTSDPEFEGMKEQIDKILIKLKPFYGDGIYSKYFKGTNDQKKKSSNLLYVYDLDALKNETLQTLMTMSVIEEIRSLIQRPEHQERGGFIVIEELGMLGRDNPVAKKFIIDAAETFRKLGFWLIGLTPRPQNYFEMEAGKAMWSVADNFVFLRMSKDNADYLAENSPFIDEVEADIISSLKVKKGQFTEIFYTNKDKTNQGAFRYYQTSYDRWLAPTNQEDLVTLEKAIKKFKGKAWQALLYLVLKEKHGDKIGGKLESN